MTPVPYHTAHDIPPKAGCFPWLGVSIMQEDVVRAAVSSRSADKLAAQEERPETRSPVSVSFFNDTSKMKEMIERWLMFKLTEAGSW